MVNLESIDPLKVDFRVPEIYLRQVQVGQSLQVTLDAMPGKTYEGKVFAVNPLIDAAGRSVVIRAQVRNHDTPLRPGMFARVRLSPSDVQDALVVPEQAIVPQGDEQYVFKVVDGKACSARRSRSASAATARSRSLKGLSRDDVVVTAGQLKLRDGALVTVATAPPRPVRAGQRRAVRRAEDAPSTGGVISPPAPRRAR